MIEKVSVDRKDRRELDTEKKSPTLSSQGPVNAPKKQEQQVNPEQLQAEEDELCKVMEEKIEVLCYRL